MSILDRITHDEKSRIIISIIWGLGLAMLFRRSCRQRECIILRGPKPSDMENKIYAFDDKCYKYTAKTATCKAEQHSKETKIIDAQNPVKDYSPMKVLFGK
jgi:hypothetical protein